MFRSGWSEPDNNSTTLALTPMSKKKDGFTNRLEELNYGLDFLEEVIRHTMDEYIESLRPPSLNANKSRRSSAVLESFKKFRSSQRGGGVGDIASPNSNIPTRTNSTPKGSSIRTPTTTRSSSTTQQLSRTTISSTNRSNSHRSSLGRDFDWEEARFIPMDTELIADIVETIRRITELVIIGERSHAQSNDRDTRTARENMSLFETFFERHGLATLTNLLLGNSFDILNHPAVLEQQYHRQQQEQDKASSKGTGSTTSTAGTEGGETDEEYRPIPIEDHVNYKLLPPIAIATQTIQSVSMLVQNVSQATSLFFILSNNHVNELINTPLELYQAAERRNQTIASGGTVSAGDIIRTRFIPTPELAELTTHFVTFLKSLALRVTVETLQFFLLYPMGMKTEELEDIIIVDQHIPVDNNNTNDSMETSFEEDRPLDETEETSVMNAPDGTTTSNRPVSIKTVQLEFPLYERALEFCGAHHDSFVRVTAMNICLNMLRLATVIPGSGEEGEDGMADLGKSPDGVLHNAKPLPLKDRVSIAQYVCTPARVERLASPLFTKLAQLWGVLEEQFRDLDTANTAALKAQSDTPMTKVTRAKEKARRTKAADGFNNTAYSVQDELLLLEDVMKVGLTSLNEQMIEMMFATFVYPLLLQPLLLYFQRSPVPDEVLFADPLNEHRAGRPIGNSDMTAPENAIVLSPAKAAFFFLGAAFQFLTNPPLLRLLFTSLFHPLAPEATGETMIRAKADVACRDAHGNVQIRIDPMDEEKGRMKMLTDRSTYMFGTVTGQRCVSGSRASKHVASSETSCIFVLAPALAEILEFRGNDAALVARTRRNPYRKAIFQCFSLSSQLSDLRPLSVLAVETAISKFPAQFLSDMLFGVDLQKFQAMLPRDEASNGVLWQVDDRDIGGGTTAGQSRLSLGETGTGRVGFDYQDEVLSAFRNCIMRASPAANGTWKLEYDMTAAHALVCIIRGNDEALLDAAKRIDSRCRQAAEFLSDIPHSFQRHDGAAVTTLLRGLDASKVVGAKEGVVMDVLFRGIDESSPCVLNELLEINSDPTVEPGKNVYGIEVLKGSSYSDMCGRCSIPPSSVADDVNGTFKDAMVSAKAWVQLGRYSTEMNRSTPLKSCFLT